ncbi:MAG: DUF4124 domain-containing protein [Motiliproteus sp.]
MRLRTLILQCKHPLPRSPVLLFLLAVTLYSGPSSSANIYRWIDADGTLSFSQKRPAGVASTLIKTASATQQKTPSNNVSTHNHQQIRAYLDSLPTPAPPSRLDTQAATNTSVTSNYDNQPRDAEPRHSAYHNIGQKLQQLRNRKVLNDFRKRGDLTAKQRAELRQQRRTTLRAKPEYLSKKLARKAATQQGF